MRAIIVKNGIAEYRDMTAEEIAEMEMLKAELSVLPQTLEEKVAELQEALDLILSGVTE